MAHRDYSMRQLSQELRKNATKEENKLWYRFLKQLTPQWRRQVVIDRFILDFYCRKLKLAIELDGAQHFSTEGKLHDLARTERLSGLDIQVIRFSNGQVDKQFYDVCSAISLVIKMRTEELDAK